MVEVVTDIVCTNSLIGTCILDKPLMIVARSLYDYVMEEGADPNNRLYR